MTLDVHLSQLVDKHHRIDEAIQEEVHRPHPDDLLIADLKKQKLRIKDEIARLKSELH